MTLIQSFIKIPRSLRHARRYREIAYILIKYGLGNLIGYTKSLGFGLFSRKKGKSLLDLRKASTYEKLRMAIEELGPTFVKFGQLMSNRPDIFPEAFIKELEKLQKNVAPFPFHQAMEMIEAEYKGKKDELFHEIDPIPLASGSIAQVHKATLKSGEKLVLKIQRPNIARQIETDVEIMQYLARKIQSKLPEFGGIDVMAILNEFKNTIRQELDFYQEISHIERFQYNFKDDKDIYVPKPFKEFCCKTILAMEYIDGYTINDLFEIENHQIDLKNLAQRGANFVLKQIFTHGFFHADPHPGNILVLHDSRICFIDFGMTGTLPAKYRNLLADMILGFINQDSERIVKILKKFMPDHSEFDVNELELRVSELVEEFTYLPLNKIDSTEVLQKLLNLLLQFKLKLPPVVYMLIKALVTIEGVARKLDPDFNISEYVNPFAKKLLQSKLNPKEFIHRNYGKAIDFVNYMAEFPEIAFEVSEMVRDGKLKIAIEHKGLSTYAESKRLNSYIIALSIIAGTLFLGSALILAAHVQPLWHQLSIIGLCGMALAFLFAIMVIRKASK